MIGVFAYLSSVYSSWESERTRARQVQLHSAGLCLTCRKPKYADERGTRCAPCKTEMCEDSRLRRLARDA